MSRSAGFGEAPQQAFLRPFRAAKIASVATLALLAVSALPPKQRKNGGACFSYASSVSRAFCSPSAVYFIKRMDADTFLETVRRYTDATTITKRMVAELIQYIEVYPAVKEDGVTNQRVTIHYNCIGAFEVPDRRKIPERDILLETRKGVALSYAPAQIAI